MIAEVPERNRTLSGLHAVRGPLCDRCCGAEGRLMALSDASRQRSTSVAFGAKRTLTEPRLQKADLRSTLVQGRIGIALGIDGTRAVQLSTSSRELHAQFGHLILQPALGGDQFG